jgi:hypothetical protein
MARGNPAVPPGLRDVEQLELPVHHELAAVGDIEEDLADAVPGAGLGGRRRHGGALRGIERLGDLPDLVGAVVELPQRRLHVDGLAGAEAGDDLGQLAVGEFQGPRAQPPQPADQPVRQEQGGGERTDRQREHEHAEPDRPGQRLVGRGQPMAPALCWSLSIHSWRTPADTVLSAASQPAMGAPSLPWLASASSSAVATRHALPAMRCWYAD